MDHILGLSVPVFTKLHVVISLIGIVAGLVFFLGVGRGRWPGGANKVFYLFTALTSITGFLFPIKGPTPALIFGVISVVVLAVAALALRGGWKRSYLALALFAQWLNMVVLVIQSYLKIPALHALAPNGNEPALLASQGLVVLIVAWLGWKALRRPV